MNIQVNEHLKRVVIINLSGRVDAFNVPALRDKTQALLSDNANNFVVDLSDVVFLDSAGMASLVSLLKNSRAMGGEVRLVNPSHADVARTLSLTKFDRVFDICATVDEALTKF